MYSYHAISSHFLSFAFIPSPPHSSLVPSPPLFYPLPSSELDTEAEEKEKTELLGSGVETPPPTPAPSGLVVFGLLVMKHSYVSALIIMMVPSLTLHVYNMDQTLRVTMWVESYDVFFSM